MAGNYLRYLDVGFVQGNDWASSRPDDDTMRAVFRISRPCLVWMYEYLALPLATKGLSKVLMQFTSSSPNPPPQVVPSSPEDRDGEGFVYVYHFFDRQRFEGLGADAQNFFLLEHIHAALLRCADVFGWPKESFESARQRMIEQGFRMTVPYKKPVTSPDRRMKAQGVIEVSDRAEYFLAFYDRQMHEVRRVLISRGMPDTPCGANVFHRIEWIDPATVQITLRSGQDYWHCNPEGAVDFHFARAAAGDPHAEYQLGKMYLTGSTVLQDEERGLKLLRSAAAKGYAHAKRYLEATTDHPTA